MTRLARRLRRSVGSAAGCTAAALVLTACSVGNGPGIGAGPLGEGVGSGRSWQCAPASAGRHYAVGVRVFSNPARQSAVLSGVQVLGAHGLELAGAVVLPVQRGATGAQPSWPPTVIEPARSVQAVPVRGARLPARSHLGTEVVAPLSATGAALVSLTGFVVRYLVGGAPYAVRVPYGFQASDSCQFGCPAKPGWKRVVHGGGHGVSAVARITMQAEPGAQSQVNWMASLT